MDETRPTVQESYLREAQTMGRDYYQKVEIGGKNYFVMILQGGDLSRMQAHDTTKLRDLSEAFFSAHQDASETDLNDSDITHIDSTGIHFREGETQVSSETGISADQEDLLLKEFDSERDAIVEHYTQDKPDPVAKENVPAQYRPYLDEDDKDLNGLYDEDAIDSAIESYAFSRLNRIKDLVVSSNPASREQIDRRFTEIEDSDCIIEEALEQACATLKQHMTAQTIWKAMMNVLLPEQLIFVAAPEVDEGVLALEEEAPLPLGSSNPFGHLGSLDSLPPSPREELSDARRDREGEALNPFASVRPPPTKEGWGAMLSRWGSTAYSYAPSFRGSGSSTASREEEAFEMSPKGKTPTVVALDSAYISDYEEEDLPDLELPLPALHSARVSVHKHEEIHIEPLTAQQVYNELNLAAQKAPESTVPVSSKQAVAKAALDKIRAKMRKEEDIQAFTADEQRVIKEAIFRNTEFMQGRPYNSQLTTILGGLETISLGH